MKNSLITGIVTIGLTAILLTGCSNVPQADIDATNAAIEESKVAGADLYTPEAFTALTDSLNSAMLIIETQKSKFIKSYGEAKDGLEGVKSYAVEVKLQAEQKKEELKMKIEASVEEVKLMVEANRKLISEAPTGKEGASALKAIMSENDAIEAALIEGVELLNEGNYLNSADRVMVAKERANAINTELSTVIAKYKANARTR